MHAHADPPFKDFPYECIKEISRNQCSLISCFFRGTIPRYNRRFFSRKFHGGRGKVLRSIRKASSEGINARVSAMCAMVFVSLNGNLRPPSLDPWWNWLPNIFFSFSRRRMDRCRVLNRAVYGGEFESAINYLCRPTVLTFSPASSSFRPRRNLIFKLENHSSNRSVWSFFFIYGEWNLFFIIILDCRGWVSRQSISCDRITIVMILCFVWIVSLV